MIVKRFIDVIVSVMLLLTMSPVMLAVALAVWVKLGNPVLLRQIRPGLKGKPFALLKFRTMSEERDIDGKLLPDLERLTPFGRRLRVSSLDELPQLYNVLVGDMSLVGPRPLLVEYLQYYTEEQMRRHDVKPGITGWAQINGRNTISWDEMFKLDLWYVDNKNIYLDVKIFVKSAINILRPSVINESSGAIRERFDVSQGSNERNTK